ncbi:MAG: sigma-54 dependent transcriptional regulator [Pseudomonadota bacterium]|nr:sigma-54 dependent transcriptional regulator [Pseudomonadota bacterium]
MAHVLVVDDDRNFTPAFADLIRQEGFTVSTAHTLDEARHSFQQDTPDVAFVDLMLPDGNGIELVREIEQAATTAVVIITGHASVDSAVDALRARVWDYLTKPLDISQLRECLKRLTLALNITAPSQLRFDQASDITHLGGLHGSSVVMRHLYRMIAKVAPTDATVFLHGESGTGKELVARAIYELSPRRERPFLALNCGAVPENLIASELFGHERGSFTGASRQHKGYFERANGGTLFLDEITEMPVELQVNLLRVLETGTLVRLGGDDEVRVDVRLVAATNRDPEEAVAEGALREDLLFRLMVFPLRLPPLRERHGDVSLLARRFLAELNAEHGSARELTPEALEALESHTWPGNVRELRNAVQRAFILADHEIDAFHIAQWQHGAMASDPQYLRFSVGTSIEDAERRLIYATLEHFGGDKKQAAKALGVSLKTLYNRLNSYKDQ